jgi:uncharacterized protein (TIGR02246 family)
VVDASSTSGTSALVEWLYRTALERWNERDAAGFAALFDDDGHVVGFDGSEMDGRAEIRSALQAIFADHETAAYVAKVRDVRLVARDVAVLCGARWDGSAPNAHAQPGCERDPVACGQSG